MKDDHITKISNFMENLMTREQFQSIAGITSRTEANYRTLRKGPPFYKIGNKIYYKPDEVLQWIEQQRVGIPQRQARGR